MLALTGTKDAVSQCHYNSTRLEKQFCHCHTFGILITRERTSVAFKTGINGLGVTRRTHPARGIYMGNVTFCIATTPTVLVLAR